MKPGRALDRQVAEKVMGWRVIDYGHTAFYYIPTKDVCGSVRNCANNHEHILPFFSTSIEDAWKVVEKLQKDFIFDLNLFSNYRAYFRKSPCKPGVNEGKSESAPHAIALAALKAMGVK